MADVFAAYVPTYNDFRTDSSRRIVVFVYTYVLAVMVVLPGAKCCLYCTLNRLCTLNMWCSGNRWSSEEPIYVAIPEVSYKRDDSK